jgi:hypothetical protein
MRVRLGSRLQQGRHHSVAGQGQVAEACAEGASDGVADGGDGRAAARFADAERGEIGGGLISSTSTSGTSLKRSTG